MIGIPGLDAVVEALAHLGPESLEPCGVAADPPVAVNLHDAAKLAIGSGVKGVLRRTEWKCGTEGLVATLVLGKKELGFAQAAFEVGEKMRQRLGVIPDVGTGAVAGAPFVAQSLPGPNLSARLTEHGGRFEDGQIGRHGIDHFGSKRGIVERVGELFRGSAQMGIFLRPLGDHRIDAGKPRAVPRPVKIIL